MGWAALGLRPFARDAPARQPLTIIAQSAIIVPYGTVRISPGKHGGVVTMTQQDNTASQRAKRTRERLRAAAHRLFLRQGYLATSIDAILVEAGIASKETLYRHYDNKEALFVDVLRSLTMEQPGFPEKLAALPAPRDLPALRQALTQLAREILAMMSQPEYLPLVRMILTESPRFPQLGSLFFATVTQRGLALLTGLLREARERQVIADVDLDAVTRMLVGGLVSYVLPSLVPLGDAAPRAAPERADTLVEIIMRALAP